MKCCLIVYSVFCLKIKKELGMLGSFLVFYKLLIKSVAQGHALEILFKKHDKIKKG